MGKTTFIFIFCISLLCSFKTESWRYKQIGNSDGLSNSAVTSIFLDSKGFMWFGTWDGLNRYDGSNIKVYKPDNFRKGSISNNIIRNLLEDRLNNLWIVTEDGLNRYNPYSDSFTSFLSDSSSSEYRENRFHAVLDTDSAIWCSKYNYGITRFNYSKDCFSKPLQLDGKTNSFRQTIGFSFSPDNKLWVLSENGKITGLKKDSVWHSFKNYELPLSDSTSTPTRNWFFTYKGKLFLFMAFNENGLIRLNIETGKTQKFTDTNREFQVTTLSQSSDSSFLWGGTDDGRIFQLSMNADSSVHFIKGQLGLSGKQIKIWTITETKPDLLWIGTDGDGVYKYIMKNNYFISVGKGDLTKGYLNHNIVRAIYEDSEGNIWVGTRGNGLNIIDKKHSSTKIFDVNNGLSNNAVLSLGADQYENIWIGIDGEGIDMYEKATGKIFHFPRDFSYHPTINFGYVYAICFDSFNDLWLGTSGYGLFKLTIKKRENGKYYLSNYKHYDSNNQMNTQQGLQSNIIYSITEGSPNILWIGTRGGGLYRFNTLSENFEVFKSHTGNTPCINNNDVLSLCKAHNQCLWVGTSGGLNLIDLSTNPYQIHYFTERGSLPNNTIHAILEDHSGNIWVSTNKGLSKISYKDNEIRSYYSPDGLQSNEYTDGAACIGKKSGLFYFGGVNGFDVFNPDIIHDSKYFPRLAITNFTLFNQKNEYPDILPRPIDQLDSLVLKYNQNFFKFDFTTLNYHNKSKCHYAYKLDNFDNKFIFSGKETGASFTNVPPGKYILKIKWTNEDGIWNNNMRKIYITVLPPFWQTTWAYIIYIITGLTFVTLMGLIFVRRIQVKHKMDLERLEVEKTKELDQYKIQFFTNVAHEFRTPLTLIMAPAAQLIDMTTHTPPLFPYVKSIYNNSTRLLHLIRELIDFRKAETGNFKLKVKNGNLTTFVHTLADAFKQYAIQKGITLNIVNAEENITGWFDNNVMENILLNLISNGIKYTSSGGKVSIILSSDSDHAIIKIKDTGRGIAPDYQQKIFERFFQRPDSSVKGDNIADSAGVGLSLTKSLIELHKGTIQVESVLTQGSCFTVIIPIRDKYYTEEEKCSEMIIDELKIKNRINEEFVGLESIKYDYSHSNAEEANAAEKDTVLIVDDNKELLNLINNILYHDYNIIQATNGVEALDLLNKYDVSVVVSDIIMPNMDGLDLCRNIKQSRYTCHIPVILLTAKGELEQRIEGIESGADSYIPKPFDPRHLKVRIRKLIESRNQLKAAFRSSTFDESKRLKGLNSKDAELLGELHKFVQQNIDKEELDADEIADHLNMSKTQLYRKVKAITGFSPHGYIKNIRLKKAVELLKESKYTVSEIIYATGFKNRTYFYRSFKELYGVAPLEYVKQKLATKK